ncbi:peptidoglycan endopeptidase [Alloscardovia theropitheci]|uniref:Peptidoglycan endopeptidase n=2 Tax=Alloscardovia theropitheci TaxID=2496842 RepID=A0A4R0QX03_9BIFI|nr:peptidoglycan endopeptidase [Alloscardovia theropitheci]
MTPEQTSARDSLVQEYNTAQAAYGSNGSASSATLKTLSDALNNASAHLSDTTNSVDTYNSDINSLKDAVSKVKASAASATQSSRTSSSSSSSSSTAITVSGSGSGTDVANLGLKYLGTPYVWGGSSPSGWDCSGFVQYVYSQFGVSLPRTSGAQATVGTAVASLAEAKPGDIIANGIHAAIYLGDGKIVNALAPGLGTQVTTLSSFGGRGYSIRRVFN